jgi:cytochrome c-type biogenesis protein
MLDQPVSIAVAFSAGLLSFLSPCVLPLVPGYLSFISGVNFAAARADGGAAVMAERKTVIFNSLLFVLGFSAVFVLLGATATALGNVLNQHLDTLSKVAGVVLVLFGLHMTGLIKIKWLYQEKRVQLNSKPLGMLGAFLVGMAFAAGWTPCIGPVLGAILAMAANSDTIWLGIGLLGAYSAGLGVPFLLAAIGISQFYRFFDVFKHHLRKVEIASGVMLMAVGVLIFQGTLTQLQSWFPWLQRFAM